MAGYRFVVVLGMATMGTLMPAAAEACSLFDWLCPRNQTAMTTYAPPYAPGPAAACVPQTCGYTPVTSYRWTFSRVNRTSYQPVSAIDPCTGCATTSYQAVTSKSLLPWLHREPVTSYRMTCSPVAAAPMACGSPCGVPACGPCGGAALPAATVMPGAPPCTGCAPSTVVPAPVGVVPQPGVVVPGAAPAASVPPSLAPGPGYSQQPSTFVAPGPSADGASSAPSQQQGGALLQPMPDPVSSPSSTLPGSASPTTSLEPPRLLPPEGRTTTRPMRLLGPATGFRTVAWKNSDDASAVEASHSEEPLDTSGWHAPRD